MEHPKGTYRLADVNVALVPTKCADPNAAQLTFVFQGGQTRNLFLKAESGEVSDEFWT